MLAGGTGSEIRSLAGTTINSVISKCLVDSTSKMHAIARHVHPDFRRKTGNRVGRGREHVKLCDRQLGEQHRVALLFRGAETHVRSVLKAVSWRTLGTLDTFAISWLLTGRVEIAGSIAGLEIVTKIAGYYLHERVWAAIPWGRRPL
jgi:uncharacterized membrane protein